jgi:metal-responsive CopG/Arc/MetJ family transcriptional regulator
MISGMGSVQIAVRIPTNLLEAVDSLVENGLATNRADLVRGALERYVQEIERVRIDQAIIDGYQRIPGTVDEEATAIAALRRSIAEEPW